MSDIEIQLFKVHPELYTESSSPATDKFRIDKFTTTQFDNFSIDMNTPISPLPLPEDTSTQNVLVKMEGNSQVIRFGCKFDVNLITLSYVKQITSVKTHAGFVDVDLKPDGTSYVYTVESGITNNINLLSFFLTNFESRSIRDTFVLRLRDVVLNKTLYEGFGSVQSVTTSVEAGSPVVWNVNVDFIVGKVVSIYDADVPEIVTALEVSEPSGTTGTIRFRFNTPTRSGGSAVIGYTFAYFNKTNSTWNFKPQDTPIIPSVVSGKYQYDLTGLTVGKEFKVYMFAENASGAGTPSEITTVQL